MKAVIVNCYQDSYYYSSLEEMRNLLHTLNIEVKEELECEIITVRRSTFISSGQISRIGLDILSKSIDLVVFNHTLSALQVRNLKEQLNVEVWDRTMVIIRIFEMRAKTKEAKLEVEIALAKRQLAELTDRSSHYDQITSGKGNNRGSGEKSGEIRKYQIRREIAQKERELDRIQKRRIREEENQPAIPSVAIVGYTNAGKSTLMNRFIARTENVRKTPVLEEDRLFATLDTTTRLIKGKGHLPFLLTDTVGFIDSLPVHLVRSFGSTFEKIAYADLILEVIDLSDESFPTQEELLDRVVGNYVGEKKIARIYNKIDRISSPLPMMKENELLVSLKDDGYVETIWNLIDRCLSDLYFEVPLFIPYEDGKVFYEIMETQSVVDYREEETGFQGNFRIEKKNFSRYKKYLKRP